MKKDAEEAERNAQAARNNAAGNPGDKQAQDDSEDLRAYGVGDGNQAGTAGKKF